MSIGVESGIIVFRNTPTNLFYNNARKLTQTYLANIKRFDNDFIQFSLRVFKTKALVLKWLSVNCSILFTLHTKLISATHLRQTKPS